MDSLPRPNKTFVADFKKEFEFNGIKEVSYHIIIAAKDKQTAVQHLKEKLGIVTELIWLMDCNYKIIRDQRGRELPVQVKILYSSHTWIDKNNK